MAKTSQDLQKTHSDQAFSYFAVDKPITIQTASYLIPVHRKAAEIIPSTGDH